ncbi:unnamed protein product [Ambrosiozyma monospora]|uniref:Unnamed protein product n=1 Tax=Ambrosiozyma monospora TaxID=43982 RepID=A0A9W6YY19_AMBMO|nr:unnamed protein product [Ambrosiozyma monospora]
MTEQQLQHPEAKTQDELYSRIINNLSELNSKIAKVNDQLIKAQETNEGSFLSSQLLGCYSKNAESHLADTNSLEGPIKD